LKLAISARVGKIEAMNTFRTILAAVTIVFGILFMFTLGFQGPSVENDGECQFPDPCAARSVAVVNDPADVFDSLPGETVVTGSGAPLDPLNPVRA
jgi:hypothetical protein